MKKLIILPFLFCLSCSHLEFKSHDRIPTWGQKKQSPSERFFIQGERVFYLWGNYPEKHEIFVDNEIIDKGYGIATELSFEEFQTWQNFLWTIVSLGIYIPTNYLIQGRGVQRE